jgi:hypothetical protein
MARLKQTPTRTPRSTPNDDTKVNTTGTLSTNMTPAQMMLWHYWDDLEFVERITIAYPNLTQDPTKHYTSLQAQRSWRESWFTSNTAAWKKIRGIIYTHVFRSGAEYVLQYAPKLWVCEDSDKIAGLLRTNKMIRSEAMPFYHDFVLLDIDKSTVPNDCFAGSLKVDRAQLRRVQFKGWSPQPPAEMVGHLLDQFPSLEELVVECPDEADELVVQRPKKPAESDEDDDDEESVYKVGKDKVEKDKAEKDKVEGVEEAGFGGLLRSELFMGALKDVDFANSVDRGVRKDFNAARSVVRARKMAAERALKKHKRNHGADAAPDPAVLFEAARMVRLKLAVAVDIFSDLWLEWKAQEGQSLRGLIVDTVVDDDEPVKGSTKMVKAQPGKRKVHMQAVRSHTFYCLGSILTWTCRQRSWTSTRGESSGR